MVWKRWGMLLMVVMLAASLTAGCAGNNGNKESEAPKETAKSGEGTAKETSSPADEEKTEEIVDIEVWYTNLGAQPIDKGSPLYEFYKEHLGIGVIHPYVEWNGGTSYLNQLNLKIAANEMPDLFMPVQGLEAELAKNGAIADLTELLPEHAPNVWNAIPAQVWDVVKANDPTGQGRIYYIPGVLDYGRMGGMIRQDWLDKVGLPMPTTQEEYVKVLEAFRDGDPNGNGQKDELPTGGREQAAWMDHLFAMYGVAIDEGKPDWDLYDGELTYSAVTPNMKAALAFIAKLYKDGLLDKESLLNKKADWDGKIDADKVGNYFHWAEAATTRLEAIYKNTEVKGDYSVMPVPKVEGYEGFYSAKKLLNPVWVVKKGKDDKKLMATLKALNNVYDKSKWDALFYGVEDMHYVMENGKRMMLPSDKSVMQNKVFSPWHNLDTLDFKMELYRSNITEDRRWAIEQGIRNMEENQKYVKTIAGDGLSASIYEGYADINNRTLYVEYATKIILGQYSIDKFDEFVEKWHKSGGEEVTKRAREWYAKVKK
ncbi:ABC transporter substrate-binding protein [Paenibacillus sp. J5C_2022]|uniref:ABC transporter substrate-binding protein n=1 Tax=Paenibacillus sp. J5C2022 TaxID=2977129 RepID=UPI0021CF4A0D|nr:ABC transporter substrate-binding protein [Paenibacillus sp. J5C2022]MCU6709082.1 ABC transporter substrate-binding protein [Paenibacillus sp. J5C2022]